MGSFNRVILVGELASNPRLRHTERGQAVVTFELNVSDTYNRRDGERVVEVSPVKVEGYGAQAETIANYLREGSPLLVEGRIKVDAGGTLVVMRRFQFMPAAKAVR